MTLLSLESITKNFDSVRALDAFSLEVERGEIFGILGPSGCGKTTALRIVAGLEEPDSGRVLFDGVEITKLPAEKRGFGIVFQDYALFPNMSVFENTAFGLRSRSVAAAEINERVERVLRMVKLPDHHQRGVTELSGGEQQRVAIARALAFEPPMLLFDEPFSNLDVGLRDETRAELRRLIKQLEQTAIYVTHDQEEAFTICDRIAIVDAGRVLQTGTPRELYEHPADARIAGFLGKNNLVSAIRISGNNAPIPEFKTLNGDHLIQTGNLTQKQMGPIDRPVTLAIRPEYISIFDGASFPADNVMRARVVEVTFTGPTTTVRLDVGGLELEAVVLRLIGLKAGDACMVGLPPDRIAVLPGS
jgi:ABC-type Fe3+/spermidine/putrescine transport system ATPase subunit